MEEQLEFNTITDELENYLIEKISSYKGEIYHYTSPEGLLGILSNKKIWFSNTRFLNDSSENNYIYTLFPKSKYEYEPHVLEEDFFQLIDNIKNQYLNKDFCEIFGITFWVEHIFVASFSKDDDNLMLWNYYTKNSERIGYNVCFDNQPIEIGSHYAKYLSGEIIYDEDIQRDLVKKLLFKFNSEYKNIEEEKKISFTKSLLDIIEIYNTFFKHPKYNLEKEFRCALSHIKNYDKLPSWRTFNGIFIPYLEEEFEKDSIENICIGPTKNQELLQNSLELFLNTHKYKDVHIKKSKIPLRY